MVLIMPLYSRAGLGSLLAAGKSVSGETKFSGGSGLSFFRDAARMQVSLARFLRFGFELNGKTILKTCLNREGRGAIYT
jgi:hypothetical protein